MPFSQSIRTEALVAAARHCCVCHRYNGVGMEVHHIEPEADSGDNTASNAVALCFDCHAAAGHYNPRHPKGTKFSPRELRLARDRWHARVAQGPLGEPAADVLDCRYLVCESSEMMREIADGELGYLPVEGPLRVSNAVLDVQRSLLSGYPGERDDTVWGVQHGTEAAYLQAHPDARPVGGESRYGTLVMSRAVGALEIEERVIGDDPLTGALLGAGAAAGDLVRAYVYSCECGGASFQEVYRIRPVWGVYLAATNLSGSPLRLDAVVGEREAGDGWALRPLPSSPASGCDRHALPAARIPAGGTVVFPMATLVGPLDVADTLETASTYEDLDEERVQRVAHQDLGAAVAQTRVVGPAFWPSGVVVGGVVQDVHGFDASNVYAISREWRVGSCPHLFVRIDGGLRWVRELFVATPGQTVEEWYTVPAGARSVVVAELEHETTHLDAVGVGGVDVLRGSVLRRGEHVEVGVAPGDEVRLRGRYVVDGPTRPLPWLKHRLVSRFLAAG